MSKSKEEIDKENEKKLRERLNLHGDPGHKAKVANLRELYRKMHEKPKPIPEPKRNEIVPTEKKSRDNWFLEEE